MQSPEYDQFALLSDGSVFMNIKLNFMSRFGITEASLLLTIAAIPRVLYAETQST